MPTPFGYSSHRIALDGVACCDVRSFLDYCEQHNYPVSHVAGRANSFILPRGRHYGRGWVLMLREDVRPLLAGTPSFGHTLTFQDDYGLVNIARLGIVRVQEVTGLAGRTQDNVLCMVELADARYLGNYSVLDAAYNYRSYRYLNENDLKRWYDSTTNGGTPWTWAEIIDLIWAELPGVFGALTDAGDYPDEAPQNLIFRGVSAWDALCSVLDACSNTIYRDLAGNFRIVAKNAAQAVGRENAAHRQCVYHTTNDTGLRKLYPEKVRVYFPADYVAFQNDTDEESVAGQDAYRLTPLYSEDVTTTNVLPAAVVVPGTKASFHAPLSADYDSLGDLTNAAEVTAMAESLATLWLGALDYDAFSLHTVYHGFHPNLLPGSKTSAVSWFSTGEGSKTETLLSPLSYDPRDEVGTLGKQHALTIHSDEFRYPPDLARKHEHTSRFAVAELLDDLDCEDGDAEATLLYGDPTSGAISWEDANRVVVVINTGKAAFKQGDRVNVMWHWQVRRWLVVSPAPAQLYRSILGSSLCPADDEAQLGAYPVNINCCSDELEDTSAKNPYGLAGLAGYNVLLVWDCVEQALVVIQVEHKEEFLVRYPFITSQGCEAEYSEGVPTGNTVPTGECSVKYKKRSMAVMTCDEDETEYTLITTTVVYALTDVYQYGIDIWGEFTPFFAMCVCDPTDELLLEGVDCSYGSGSGA